MTYVIGDPNHIPVHNDLLGPIQEQADRFMVDIVLPPIRSVDDTGHTDDHNLIVTALQTIADAPPLGPTPATVATVTGSPTIDTWTDEQGFLCDRWTWNGNGSVTFATVGQARAIVIGGGGGGGVDGGGGGGGYIDTALDIDAKALRAWTITIGAGGAGAALGANGGYTYFGWLQAIGGGGGASSQAAASDGGASGGGSGRGGRGGYAYQGIGPQGRDSILTGVSYGYNNGGAGAGRSPYGTGGGPGGENSQGGDGILHDGVWYCGGGGGAAYPPVGIAYRGAVPAGANGAANTGGGAGTSGTGGSGRVRLIIRQS